MHLKSYVNHTCAIDSLKERIPVEWLEKEYLQGEGKFWKLTDVPWFLPLDDETTTMLVLKCYVDLEKLIMDEDVSKFGVSGNPGIGKTYFGIYLINTVKRGGNVIYDRGNPHFINLNTISPLDGQPPDVVELYILDAHVKGMDMNRHYKASKNVYLYSPASYNKDWNLYQKSTAYNMPVWDKNECSIFAQKENVKKEDWINRYDWFGGIPRYIFDVNDSMLRELNRNISKAIRTANPQRLVSEVDLNESHLLLHRINNDEGHVDFHMEFASDYVKEEILKFMLENEVSWL